MDPVLNTGNLPIPDSYCIDHQRLADSAAGQIWGGKGRGKFAKF